MYVSDASDTSIFSLNHKTSVMVYFQYSVCLLVDATLYIYRVSCLNIVGIKREMAIVL